MLQDMRRGAPTEIEAINCSIAREAARQGVPAPVNELLCKLVRAARGGENNHDNSQHAA
jgi:2-dehydropantoate 2-reductase